MKMSDDDKRAWAKWMAFEELDEYEARDALRDAIDVLPIEYLDKQFAYIYADGGEVLAKARKRYGRKQGVES